MVESFQPHIIAVTESWGNAEIDDSELYITGYTMFHKDRPLDARGGGVLLFVSEDLGAVEWLPSTKFPEQTWCRLCINNDMELLVGVCYNSRNKSLFPNNDELLQKLINEVSNKHMLLMGDFNYKGINWLTSQASETTAQQFLDCLEDSFLTQHVTEPTREDSILDLVITDEPDMIDEVKVLGHFSSSDHNALYWTTNVAVKKVSTNRLIRDFNKADIASMKKELRSLNWNLDPDMSVSELWDTFKKTMEELLNKYVPVKKSNTGKHKKAIWMTHKAVKAVRRKHNLFSKYKDTSHPAYIKASCTARKEVKRAKRNFEAKLSKNIKKDTKSFYAYVRSRCKTKVKVGF